METIKKLILLLSVTAFFLLVRPSFAQMMGGYQGQAPSQSDIQKQQNEQNEGQQFFQGLKEGKISCQKLTNDDFEKLGEYFMGQMIGDTQRHVLMNNMMQSMMGENGEEQMHIVMGQRGSGCLENAPFPSNVPSFMQGMMGNFPSNTNRGTGYMMGIGYPMMSGYYGLGGNILALAFHFAVLIDLILFGALLYKKLRD